MRVPRLALRGVGHEVPLISQVLFPKFIPSMVGLPIAVTDLDDGVTVVLARLVQAQDRPGGPDLPAGYRETALPSIW